MIEISLPSLCVVIPLSETLKISAPLSLRFISTSFNSSLRAPIRLSLRRLSSSVVRFSFPVSSMPSSSARVFTMKGKSLPLITFEHNRIHW